MLAAEVGPCVLKLERFVKGDARQFGCDGADARGGDATALSSYNLSLTVEPKGSAGGFRVGSHCGPLVLSSFPCGIF